MPWAGSGGTLPQLSQGLLRICGRHLVHAADVDVVQRDALREEVGVTDQR